MTAMLTEGCLKPHPFVKDCSPEFLNHLEEFATEATFEADELIFSEGEYADRFYLISEGKIRLESGSNGKPGIAIQILGPGDVLGWSWLYPPFEWHFSARAIEPCKVVVLKGASLLVRAEEDPAFGYELMKRLSKHVIQRLQSTRRRLVEEVAHGKESEGST
jgi:CRP/FNR family transcriptional regulator, cyclic AMP receptor protein